VALATWGQGDVSVEAGRDWGGEDVPEVEGDDVGGHEIDLRAPSSEFAGLDVTGEHAIRIIRRYRHTRGPVV
jgi:hypothetical protein